MFKLCDPVSGAVFLDEVENKEMLSLIGCLVMAGLGHTSWFDFENGV
jgi:hypothetical protein